MVLLLRGLAGNSNTTLVKVKFNAANNIFFLYQIQIQHLLKLNRVPNNETINNLVFKYNTC